MNEFNYINFSYYLKYGRMVTREGRIAPIFQNIKTTGTAVECRKEDKT